MRRSNHDVGCSPASARLFTNRGGVNGAVGGDSKRGDFTLGSLVEDEAIGGGFSGSARNAKDAAARFGAGDEIAVAVEGEDADVGFVAGVKELAFAVGRNGEDLALVASGDVKGTVGSEGEIPDVFGFGVEEDGFFAGQMYLVLGSKKTDFSPEAETR